MDGVARLFAVDRRNYRERENCNRGSDQPALADAKRVAAEKAEQVERRGLHDAAKLRVDLAETMRHHPIGGVETKRRCAAGQQPKSQIEGPTKLPLEHVSVHHQRRDHQQREKIGGAGNAERGARP